MQDSSRLIQIDNSVRQYGVGRFEQGIVSPCSSCRNRLAETENGRPACPRRHWMSQAEKGEEVDPVLLEKNSAALRRILWKEPPPDGLENPVYSHSFGTVLVWVAVLSDNPERVDPETGKRAAPDLALVASSDAISGYPTEFLQCRPAPYIPGQPGRGFSDMIFREWEIVLVESSSSAFRPPGGGPPPVAGWIRRAAAPLVCITLPPARSVNPSGF